MRATTDGILRQVPASGTDPGYTVVRDAVGTAVDPDQVLGPQAKFAGYGHQHEAPPPPSTRSGRFSADEDEFRSVFE